ncbi:MAG: 50S ribosomal protein L4 [Candidatus Firestonebacteria bacterium]
MPKLSVHDITDKEVESIELKDEIFGIKSNQKVITEAVLNELSNKRKGIASTKTRAEVRGGGKKPWKQKGTGRARHGSIREPQWRGGGIAHGPKPRSYYYKLPDKVKKLAFRSIISDRIKENNILILNELKIEKIKTKGIIEILKNLKLHWTKTLIITDGRDDNLKKSVKNIKNVKLIYLNNINCHDLLKFDKIVFTKLAITNLEKQL